MHKQYIPSSDRKFHATDAHRVSFNKTLKYSVY